MYGTCLTVGSLVMVGAKDRTRRPGIKVGSDEKFMEVGRIAECDFGGTESICRGRDQIRGYGDTPQSVKTWMLDCD